MEKNKNNKKIKVKVKKTALRSDTKRSIVAVVCFALAILSLLSIFNLAGLFGRSFFKFSQLLFGRGFLLVPIGFGLASLALLFPHLFSSGDIAKRKHIYVFTFIGVGLLILSILSIFHIFGGVQKAGTVRYGGYLGMIFGYPGLAFLGFLGSMVIFLAFLVISILITFNIPLKRKKKEESLAVQQELQAAQKNAGEKLSFWQKIKQLAMPKYKIQQAGQIKEANIPTTVEIKEIKDKAKESLEAIGLISRQKAVKKSQLTNVKLPPLDILEGDKGQPTSGDIKANLNIIKRTLQNFGIEVEMAEVNIGPTVTQYTLRPAHGVKLARITALQNDLALALAAHPIRLETPIPGRSLVGIEIPNKAVIMVRLRNLLDNPFFKNSASNLVFALGRNVAGQPVYADIARMPHLLIAGATGTGKTIAINGLISCLLFQNSSDTLRMIMIDPKRVEFTAYNGIPHLLTPVIVQNNKAVNALRWALSEMDRRFNVLQEKGARDIASYNAKVDEIMPFIVIVIDELADLMSSCGREVEACVVRLAQMARAVGIHLVVATQRPSVEVITGLIKANITTRMAFQVASQVDSRTILDMAGAEKLLGNGDMLFMSAESARPRRIQGTYLSDKEVSSISNYWRQAQEVEYDDKVVDSSKITLTSESRTSSAFSAEDDELYEEAKDVIMQAGKASASLLQRRLRVGYARAARLLDILEENNIIGPADGAKPRDVLVSQADKSFKGEEKDSSNY